MAWVRLQEKTDYLLGSFGGITAELKRLEDVAAVLATVASLWSPPTKRPQSPGEKGNGPTERGVELRAHARLIKHSAQDQLARFFTRTGGQDPQIGEASKLDKMAGSPSAASVMAFVSGEVEAETPALMAIARALGEECRPENTDFLKCKSTNERPGACLDEGRGVTRCALNLFEKTEKHCSESFMAYSKCFEQNNFRYERCRAQQKAFEACIAPQIQGGARGNRGPVNFEDPVASHRQKK